MQTLGLIYFFLQNYLVPFLFVIGFLYFLYGVIQFFIIGNHSGDESMKQHGREHLLSATSWFFIALVAYSIIAGLGWLASSAASINSRADTDASFDAGVGGGFNSSDGVLNVPNAPQENPYLQ